MQENYSVYLGSACKRNYQESIAHVQGMANYLYGKGYWDLHDYDFKKKITLTKTTGKSNLEETLNIIKTGVGNPLGSMRLLADYYDAQSSLDLLLNSDIKHFKQNAYAGAKLRILGSEDPLSWVTGYNTSCFFLPIMSDNPELIHFLINHRNDFSGLYKRTDTCAFFLKNTLLALAGDWKELEIRAEIFLNEPKKQKKDEKRVPDHEFYLALCNKDVIGMQIALNKLLEPKLAKQAVYDNNVWFDFYLQMQVLMYAKIASIHRFDLDINSPIAPKELIEYKPLEKYEDPYDFMKGFDYNQPLEHWINFWKNKILDVEQKKKKGIFSWLKRALSK